MKRSILPILLLFCVVLTGCQAGRNDAGSFYAVVTNTPTVTQSIELAAAETQVPTQAPTDEPFQNSGIAVQINAPTLETIAQQIDAPEHTTGEWRSSTGKTVIKVDAQVIIPSVETINTYMVTGRDVNYEDTMAVALAAAPGTDWDRDWIRFDDINQRWTGDREEATVTEHNYETTQIFNFKWYPNSDGSLDYSPYVKGHPELQDEYATVDCRNWYTTTGTNDKRLMARIDYSYNFGVNHSIYNYQSHALYAKKADGEVKIDGQSMTWSEATAMADTFVRSVDEALSLYCFGPVAGEFVGYNASTKKYSQTDDTHDAYWFCYTRVVDGVQVTHTSSTLTYGDDLDYTVAPDYEMLSLVIDGDRIIGVYWNAPMQIGQMMQADVTLLPFESIMDIFGAVSPLSIQGQENAFSKNGWMIYEIRLGYMPVLNKNANGIWELRPVWDFFGVRDLGDEANELANPLTCALTIDAIDGTVIDRKYGY